MLVSSLILIVALNFPFFKDAVCEGGFMNWICLASHGTFISSYFVSLDEYRISWDFHTLVDLHHIPHQHIVLMNLDQFTFPNDGHSLAFVSYTVKLRKLSLFGVVVGSSYQPADGHCHQNDEPFDPGSCAIVGVGSAHLNGDGEQAGSDENLEDKVVKSVPEQLAEAGERRLIPSIAAKHCPALFHGGSVTADAPLMVGSEGSEKPV
jgi:hypothetical protein